MFSLYYYFGGGSTNLALIFIPIILVLFAQAMVKSTYNKYSKVENHRGMTGFQAARKILDFNGLQDVQIFVGQGQLSDFYDPKKNIINLSPDVYNGSSIASLAIAAHEVGHAIQHAQKYPAIALRNVIMPAAMTASSISWVIIFMGLIFSSFSGLLYVGIILMLVVALFQVVTLPLEFNASNRALQQLESYALLDYDEIPHAKKMLKYAALTYVVALITTLAEIARLILIARSRD